MLLGFYCISNMSYAISNMFKLHMYRSYFYKFVSSIPSDLITSYQKSKFCHLLSYFIFSAFP